MSSPNSASASAIFGEEDNTPCPLNPISGLSIQSVQSGESASPIRHPLISFLNGNEQTTPGLNNYLIDARSFSSDVEKADTEDDESLILFSNERDNFNAVNVNHESRVVKLLASVDPVKIKISEAGKSNEGMANSLRKYIVYTIKLVTSDGAKDEIQTRRRYSDFESLREILIRIFPLVIIPPIPSKNYLALFDWNGLVGSSGSSTWGVTEGHLDNTLHLGGLNAYSYINSRHLNKSRLIEHRKRLLANFLNNCLRMKQIRKLNVFAKFLDPTANWSDEVTLVKSQLPKLIYQLNPENGLKTEEIYAELPLPVSGNALGFSFVKANNLAQKTSQLFGSATSEFVNAASRSKPGEIEHEDKLPDNLAVGENQLIRPSQLDGINTKIMNCFAGLSNDYVDLGVAFNQMSLGVAEESKAKLNKDSETSENSKLILIFDKIGSAFDRSYLLLSSLMAELETKFSEPLGEAVQYTTVLNSVKKFQERKLRQQSLVDNELKEKRKDLAEKMRSQIDLKGKDRIGEAFNKSTPKDLKAKGGPFSKFPSFKKLTNYVSAMIDQTPELTRKERITKLQKTIAVVEKCQKIMLEDVAYVTCEIDKNQEAFKEQEFATTLQILRNYNLAFVSWAKKNLEIWEEIKEEIEKTEF